MKAVAILVSGILCASVASANSYSSEDSSWQSFCGSVGASSSQTESETDCSRDVKLRSEAIVQAALRGEITAQEAAELLQQPAVFDQQ